MSDTVRAHKKWASISSEPLNFLAMKGSCIRHMLKPEPLSFLTHFLAGGSSPHSCDSANLEHSSDHCAVIASLYILLKRLASLGLRSDMSNCMFHMLELKCVTSLYFNALSSRTTLSSAALAASGTKEFCGGLEIGDTGRKPADFEMKFSFLTTRLGMRTSTNFDNS